MRGPRGDGLEPPVVPVVPAPCSGRLWGPLAARRGRAGGILVPVPGTPPWPTWAPPAGLRSAHRGQARRRCRRWASRRAVRSIFLTGVAAAASYAARSAGSAPASASASSAARRSGGKASQYALMRSRSACAGPSPGGPAPAVPAAPRGRLRLGTLCPAPETGRRREVLPDGIGEVGADVLDPLRKIIDFDG